MRTSIHGSIGIATVGLAIAAAFGQATYTVTDLGTLGGPGSSALALNNMGIVVGISSTRDEPGVSRAFRWSEGSMIDLGTLGGPSAEAFDINDSGQITGRAETADSIRFNETFHAFRWEDGAMLDVGTSGGQRSRGWAINSQGFVAGASQICWVDPKNPGGPCFPSGNEYAFFWDGGRATDLGGLSGSSDSSVLGMNASSLLVGQSIIGSARHAVFWDHGQIVDLGTLGG
jgi:probable HAF family extracellular repeat protein